LEGPQDSTVASITPDRKLHASHFVAGVSQLPQLFELGPSFAHVFECLAAQIELAGVKPWPIDAETYEQGLK
jgi:hypothetical protein